MRNYRKLKEKLHNDVDEVKKEVNNLNKIAVEVKKISEVARDANLCKIGKLNRKTNFY